MPESRSLSGLGRRKREAAPARPVFAGFAGPLVQCSCRLAGGLARAPAIGSAAVPLALTAAMVGEEKLPARHALALSRLGHRRSPTNPSSATTTSTEHSSDRSLKKTAGGAEEDRQRR